MFRDYNLTKEKQNEVNHLFVTTVVGCILLSLMLLALQGAYSLESPMGFVICCMLISFGWYCYLGYRVNKFNKSLELKSK